MDAEAFDDVAGILSQAVSQFSIIPLLHHSIRNRVDCGQHSELVQNLPFPRR